MEDGPATKNVIGMKEATSLPKLIERFLSTVCPEELYEEIEGDLIQRYNKNVSAYGQSRANRKLMVDTIRYVRPARPIM